MTSLRERINGGFDSINCGLNEAPFAPPTFDTFVYKYNVGVISQALKDFFKISLRRVGVKMNSNIIASGCQLTCLPDYCAWTFMTQEDESYSCH